MSIGGFSWNLNIEISLTLKTKFLKNVFCLPILNTSVAGVVVYKALS